MKQSKPINTSLKSTNVYSLCEYLSRVVSYSAKSDGLVMKINLYVLFISNIEAFLPLRNHNAPNMNIINKSQS